MEPEVAASAARRLSRLEPPDLGLAGNVSYGPDVVEQLIPHRQPFRFIDGISQVDPRGQRICGHFDVQMEDPIFAGHFPGEPVFPGVLQVEAIGQLGLCLASFIEQGSVQLNDDFAPASVRAVRIHHAMFVSPVKPGTRMEVYAEMLELDDFLGVVGGLVRCGDEVCSTAVLEVYFV